VITIVYAWAMPVLQLQGISPIDFKRHLRLACKRGEHAGRLIKDGHSYSLTPTALAANTHDFAKTLNGVKDHPTKDNQVPAFVLCAMFELYKCPHRAPVDLTWKCD